MLEKFENTAIFLTSTLTVVKTELFKKRSSNRRNLKKPHSCFRVNRTEHILKMELFESHGVMTIMWPPWLRFPQTNPNWPLIVAFLKVPFAFDAFPEWNLHFQILQRCVDQALMHRSFLAPDGCSTTKQVILLSIGTTCGKSCLQVERWTLFQLLRKAISSTATNCSTR